MLHPVSGRCRRLRPVVASLGCNLGCNSGTTNRDGCVGSYKLIAVREQLPVVRATLLRAVEPCPSLEGRVTDGPPGATAEPLGPVSDNQLSDSGVDRLERLTALLSDGVIDDDAVARLKTVVIEESLWGGAHRLARKQGSRPPSVGFVTRRCSGCTGPAAVSGSRIVGHPSTATTLSGKGVRQAGQRRKASRSSTATRCRV